MSLTDIPAIDELVDVTGQSREQLRKDRETASEMTRCHDGE